MASATDWVALPEDPMGERMTADAVTVVLPRQGYEKVVRLVAAGLVSRLGFGFETVDDVQLAIELVVRSLPGEGDAVTLRFTSDGRELAVEIGPAGTLSLDQPLRPLDGAGVELGVSLSRLVDSVELREAVVVLAKTLPAAAA